LQEKKGIPLIWKIALGFILGVGAGLFFGDKVEVVKPLGTIFISLLKMLIVPLVFTSLVVGTASIGDPLSLGRIGFKTVVLYLLTTAVAITIGLGVGSFAKPGVGMNLERDVSGQVVSAEVRGYQIEEGKIKSQVAAMESRAQAAPKGLVDVIVNIFPTNPIKSLADGNMLQIIVFAIFFGIAAVLAGEKGKFIVDVMSSAAEVMYKVTHMVMHFAPFGVFALIAVTVSQYGPSVLLPFGKVILAVAAGCVIHAVVVYSGLVTLFTRKSPFWFFGGIKEATLTAFVTRSSAATLPVTMECTQNMGVSEKISSFVLPLGATINMDGTALYQGVCALFVAQAFGIELTTSMQISIILTATLASVGTAGVPGAGLIMLTLVLTQAGLPLEGVALIAGIDAVLDMFRTALNITGDACVATVIAKTENELDIPKAA
jgi:Na+/H+-dicarboxylate symporter